MVVGLALGVGRWVGKEAQKYRDEKRVKRVEDILWVALAALHNIEWDPERDDPKAIADFERLTAKLRELTGTTVDQIKSYTGRYVQVVTEAES